MSRNKLPVDTIYANYVKQSDSKQCCSSGCCTKKRSEFFCSKHYTNYQRNDWQGLNTLYSLIGSDKVFQKCVQCDNGASLSGLCYSCNRRQKNKTSAGKLATFNAFKKSGRLAEEYYYSEDEPTNETISVTQDKSTKIVKVMTNVSIIRRLSNDNSRKFVTMYLKSLKDSEELDFAINYFNNNVTLFFTDSSVVQLFIAEEINNPSIMDVNGRWRKDDDRFKARS